MRKISIKGPQHTLEVRSFLFFVARSSTWSALRPMQLLFIAAVFGLAWLVKLAAVRVPAAWQRAVAYGIGSVAAFWVVERTLGVFE